MFTKSKNIIPSFSDTEYCIFKSLKLEKNNTPNYYLNIFKECKNGDAIIESLDKHPKYSKILIYTEQCKYQSFDILLYCYDHISNKLFLQVLIYEELKNWIIHNKVDLDILYSNTVSKFIYNMFVLNVR